MCGSCTCSCPCFTPPANNRDIPDPQSLAILKTLLLTLEKLLDAQPLPQNGDGATHPGFHIFQLLEQINVTYETKDDVLTLIDKVSDAMHAVAWWVYMSSTAVGFAMCTFVMHAHAHLSPVHRSPLRRLGRSRHRTSLLRSRQDRIGTPHHLQGYEIPMYGTIQVLSRAYTCQGRSETAQDGAGVLWGEGGRSGEDMEGGGCGGMSITVTPSCSEHKLYSMYRVRVCLVRWSYVELLVFQPWCCHGGTS